MKKKIDYLTFASVISAISVVYLHVNGCFWDFARERYWYTANVIECFFYFAVPVFFMISGITLMDFGERYTIGTYYKKRITKTVIPYVIWSILGLLFRIFYLRTTEAADVDADYILNGLVNGSLVSIFWFFRPLFCAYLSIPILAAIPKEKRKKVFTYAAVTAFIVNISIPFVNSLIGLKVNYSLSIAAASGYLFYILVGYLLHTWPVTRRQELFFYLLSAAGFLLQCIGTYCVSMPAGKVVETFKGYTNVPGVLYSIGMFLFLKRFGTWVMQHHLFHRLFSFLGRYTFSLYLTHWFLLSIIVEEEWVRDTHSIVYRLTAPLIIAAVSAALTALIRLIPRVGKTILP